MSVGVEEMDLIYVVPAAIAVRDLRAFDLDVSIDVLDGERGGLGTAVPSLEGWIGLAKLMLTLRVQNIEEATVKFRSFLFTLLATLLWAKGNLSVTTNFASADASGTITDIQSVSLGPYSDGIASIGSILTTNGYNHQIWGDWQFDDLSSPVSDKQKWPPHRISPA